MTLLQNTTVERPDKMFYVELVMFGTLTRAAMRRTVKVLAQTEKGARKICKAYYRRSEIKGAREVAQCLDLFAVS
jgi:hypothetical protein